MTLFSEISKLLIISLLFYDIIPLYLFAVAVMICLRSTTGGLHFYTYCGCFIVSALYLFLAIRILPLIQVPLYASLILLLGCLLICYVIGPVTSKYRPTPPPQRTKKYRSLTCGFIFVYSIIFYIFPENSYLITGFWVVILHSLQLIFAKLRKEVN